MLPLEEYLQRVGAKYFVAFLMLCYVVGTLVFNIYLRNLGISDFDFLQLRYMITGAVFMILSALFFAVLWGLLRWILPTPKKEPEEKKKKKEKTLSFGLFEIVLTIFALIWTPVYATQIFPKIPSSFGGAKPTLARLIADQSTIEEINEIIAFETGIDASNLPFEILRKNLAVGANVKILDKNADRIWLILTRDLYLSSKSNLAKNLIEAGENSENLISEQESRFVEKPLLVDARDIKSISFTLYEPPEVLTNEDLAVAAKVLSQKDDPEGTMETEKIVEQIIAAENPEAAKKVIAIARETASKPFLQDPEAEIKEILDQSFNQAFLDFRADTFSKSLLAADRERFNGVDFEAREQWAKLIGEKLHLDFGIEVHAESYLESGVRDKDFNRNIATLVQGTENAQVFWEKLETFKVKNLIPEEIETKAEFSGSGMSFTGTGMSITE